MQTDSQPLKPEQIWDLAYCTNCGSYRKWPRWNRLPADLFAATVWAIAARLADEDDGLLYPTAEGKRLLGLS